MGFLGFRRRDGGVGARNHVAVISTVVCANGVVEAIRRAVPQVKAITHTEGCGRGPADLALASRTLIGLGRNPNVAAVLIVGLGCEFIKPEVLHQGIGGNKPLELLCIQDEGGSVKTAAKGIEIAKKFLQHATAAVREPCDFSELVLGLECGGSDAMSGVTANPLVGVASDWLVEQGGTVILSETTEMIGTEKMLAARAVDSSVAKRLTGLIEGQYQRAQDMLGPLANMIISPGNVDGGLTTIQEKSLGCVIKGGTSTIREVADYAETPSKKGLVIMDTPGSDIFSLTAMAAGGAQIILFTTGRGSPAGFPIVPVIKIATNTPLFEKMGDDMDVNAGVLLDGASFDQAGESLIEQIRHVAEGRLTKAEKNLNDLVAIHTTGPSF